MSTDFNIFRPDKDVTGMVQINDNKHFLRIEFQDQHITGEIICEADPKNGECRSPHYDTCQVQESWNNLKLDMLAPTNPMALPAIDFPVKYYTQGASEDFEDWVTVVGPPRITESDIKLAGPPAGSDRFA